jgi:hypothetical protein
MTATETPATPAGQEVIGLDDVADGLAEIGAGHPRAQIVVDPHRTQ